MKYRSVQSCRRALWWNSLFLLRAVAALIRRGAFGLLSILCGLRNARGLGLLDLGRCGRRCGLLPVGRGRLLRGGLRLWGEKAIGIKSEKRCAINLNQNTFLFPPLRLLLASLPWFRVDENVFILVLKSWKAVCPRELQAHTRAINHDNIYIKLLSKQEEMLSSQRRFSKSSHVTKPCLTHCSMDILRTPWRKQ